MMTNIENQGISKPIAKCAIDLLSIASPYFAAACRVADFTGSMSDTILMQKICDVISQQDQDFERRLKISENFDKDKKGYEKTVKQLIYTIESINEVDMLDIYANLLRAYMAELITKDDFLRLGWVASNIFYEDLLFLRELYKQREVENSLEAKKLEYYGLATCRTETWLNAGLMSFYSVSPLGLRMLSCGIDYDNHYDYK